MSPRKTAIVALALVLSAPLAASAQVDITGDWVVTVESPQGAATVDASMKQVGEELTGTISTPMGSVEFKGKILKDLIDVKYSLNLQGNVLEIVMTGKVASDEISGNLSLGGLGDVPWTARRKGKDLAASAPAAAAASPAPEPAGASTPGDVSGRWDVVFNVAGNPMPATAVFSQEGEKVTGTITSLAGETAVAGVLSGTSLKLDVNVETPQGQVGIMLTGEVGASGISGKATIAGLGDADWTATRSR